MALVLWIGLVSIIVLGTGVYALRKRMKPVLRENALLQKMMAKLETDLADRRGIERELAHMASFADMAPNPIVEIGKDGLIGYVNPAAEQLFPTLAKEGLKHPLFEGVQAASDELAREKKALLVRPIKIADRVYDQQISLLDGGPRIRLYLSDITELKRLDQLKTDFVNMVSHELRTPLTSIAASIRMIATGMMGPINADQTDSLHMAQVNIDRLSRMINDLLDVGKIEAGKLELNKVRVDLKALMKEVGLSFEPLAQERGLHIETPKTPEPILVSADRDKILQVVTNLVNNSLKFTEQGSIELSITIQGKEVYCRVSDTGPGIPPAYLPALFGKFQQAGPAPKGREKGTGLGLSLCKGLIELHGGRIWAENRSPQGSQFTFVLPAE